jgi:hypothetical protein
MNCEAFGVGRFLVMAPTKIMKMKPQMDTDKSSVSICVHLWFEILSFSYNLMVTVLTSV